MALDRAGFEGRLAPLLESLQLSLGSTEIEKLWSHYALLTRWNQRMNLTAIRQPGELVRRHFGESLAVARVIGEGVGPIVDVGSGAGFPGIPIAVCLPQRRVTLVESIGKKVTFLKEASRNQENIAVYGGRFEGLEGHFEWACVRAVAARSVRGQLTESVDRVALVVSAKSVEETSVGLGLSGVETHILPWDARSAVLSGRLLSST